MLKNVRMVNLDRHIDLFKEQDSIRIVEIGVYQGDGAIRMISRCCQKNVEYFGFDLFDTEEVDEEKRRGDIGKRRAPSLDWTLSKIRSSVDSENVRLHLFKGRSKDTLPRRVIEIGYADLILIDGGHSLETVENDWRWSQKMMPRRSVVLFDDYLDSVITRGAKPMIDFLMEEKGYDVEILDPADVKPSTLVRMASVRRRHV